MSFHVIVITNAVDNIELSIRDHGSIQVPKVNFIDWLFTWFAGFIADGAIRGVVSDYAGCRAVK